MANPTTAPIGFLALLASPWSVLPITAGASVGIIGWIFDQGPQWTVVPPLAGTLFALGLALTVRLLGGARLDPEIARLRQELLEGLEALGRGGLNLSAEAGRLGEPAQTEV